MFQLWPTWFVGLVLLLGVLLSPKSSPAAEQNNPAPISTPEIGPRLAPFDRLFEDFLAEHKLPGASLAIAKDGQLVYARGYGWADVEAGEPMRPETRLRIASLSKPLTAVAVLKLVEQGKLSLDDRVLSRMAGADCLPPAEKIDPRAAQITVRHLLQHSGGWDRAASFDPMFRAVEIAANQGVAPPAGPKEVIRETLARPLDFTPGEKFAYSNLGYCLLGRVIEQASGQSYEQYVQTHVLAPLGIRRMTLGKTLLADRADGEARYYAPTEAHGPAVLGPMLGQSVPQPYGAWYLEAMDAHGGWIASASDLVRWAAALDAPSERALLSKASLRAMHALPSAPLWRDEQGQPQDAYYACGWSVRPVGTASGLNAWHTGALPGTSTLLVRRHDGLCWAVLLNSRASVAGKLPVEVLGSQLHQAAKAVLRWPTLRP